MSVPEALNNTGGEFFFWLRVLSVALAGVLETFGDVPLVSFKPP